MPPSSGIKIRIPGWDHRQVEFNNKENLMQKTIKIIGWIATAAVLLLLAYLGFIYASSNTTAFLSKFLQTKDGALFVIIISSGVIAGWLIRDICMEVSRNGHGSASKGGMSKEHFMKTPEAALKKPTVTSGSYKTPDEVHKEEISRLKGVFRERLNQTDFTSNAR
jgi:hypothetical protein